MYMKRLPCPHCEEGNVFFQQALPFIMKNHDVFTYNTLLNEIKIFTKYRNTLRMALLFGITFYCVVCYIELNRWRKHLTVMMKQFKSSWYKYHKNGYKMKCNLSSALLKMAEITECKHLYQDIQVYSIHKSWDIM